MKFLKARYTQLNIAIQALKNILWFGVPCVIFLLFLLPLPWVGSKSLIGYSFEEYSFQFLRRLFFSKKYYFQLIS